MIFEVSQMILNFYTQFQLKIFQNVVCIIHRITQSVSILLLSLFFIILKKKVDRQEEVEKLEIRIKWIIIISVLVEYSLSFILIFISLVDDCQRDKKRKMNLMQVRDKNEQRREGGNISRGGV